MSRTWLLCENSGHSLHCKCMEGIESPVAEVWFVHWPAVICCGDLLQQLWCTHCMYIVIRYLHILLLSHCTDRYLENSAPCALSCVRPLWPHNSSLPGSSIPGIFQARVLQGCHVLLQGMGRSCISCTAGEFFTRWATGEALFREWKNIISSF